MLGVVLGATLVLAVFSSVIFTEIYADSLIVNFDKDLYENGDSLTITGQVLEFGMPVIAMSIYDPDGKILSANNLEISSENSFSKTVTLESPIFEKTGEYSVKFDYGQISETHYFLLDNGAFTPEIFVEDIFEPEIILLYTEKKQYTDNEVIEITGLVSSLDSPTVLIGIYDPFGMPAGFYFGNVDSNMEFSTSFLVKDGVNFRTDGTYSVKAHYAESEAISFFDYHKVLPETIVEATENIDDSIIEDKTIDESENNVDVSEKPSAEIESETTDEKKDIPKTEPTLVESPKIIKNDQENKNTKLEKPSIQKINDSENKQVKIKQEKKSPQIKTKENNLTVEDIELGKLLNQIKLECDSSTYTDTISYYDGMGPALYRLCKFDNSLNFFNESLKNNPNDVEILVNKGSTLGKLGYFSEAIAYYDHAIVIDPNFLPAKNNKANALANLGNYNEAIFLYNEILEQNPNYLTARKNLELVLSSNFDITEISSESTSENTLEKNSNGSEKSFSPDFEKLKSTSFFDEMGSAFSSLSSLFGFLN